MRVGKVVEGERRHWESKGPAPEGERGESEWRNRIESNENTKGQFGSEGRDVE